MAKLAAALEANPSITSVAMHQFGVVHNELTREAISAAALRNREAAINQGVAAVAAVRAAAGAGPGAGAGATDDGTDAAAAAVRKAVQQELDGILHPPHMTAIFSVYRVE